MSSRRTNPWDGLPGEARAPYLQIAADSMLHGQPSLDWMVLFAQLDEGEQRTLYLRAVFYEQIFNDQVRELEELGGTAFSPYQRRKLLQAFQSRQGTTSHELAAHAKVRWKPQRPP